MLVKELISRIDTKNTPIFFMKHHCQTMTTAMQSLQQHLNWQY